MPRKRCLLQVSDEECYSHTEVEISLEQREKTRKYRWEEEENEEF